MVTTKGLKVRSYHAIPFRVYSCPSHSFSVIGRLEGLVVQVGRSMSLQ
jgi:hypothetical protein